MADQYNSAHTGAEIDQAVSDVQNNKDAWSSKPQPSDTIPKAPGTASAGTSAAYARGDHVHPKQAVTKSDVGLGNVDNVKQYSASNPPPYPVTSVNGATGEVNSTFYVTVTQGDNNSATADKTGAEVYAAYAAGYAVYAIVKFTWETFPYILPLVVALSISGTVVLGFAALGSTSPTDLLGSMSVACNGNTWLAWSAAVAKTENIPVVLPNPEPLNFQIGNKITSYDGSVPKTVEIPEGVPTVTTSDNGKFLRVVNGAWVAVTIPDANGGSF